MIIANFTLVLPLFTTVKTIKLFILRLECGITIITDLLVADMNQKLN